MMSYKLRKRRKPVDELNVDDCISDVNIKSLQDSVRPLHLASRYNATNAVTFLLTQKADVNIRDIKGRTPLHYATRRGHDKTSKVMIYLSEI